MHLHLVDTAQRVAPGCVYRLVYPQELERIGRKLGEAIKSSACADISEGLATIKRRIVLPQRMDFSDEERKTLKYGFSERLSRMSDPAAKREIESCLLVLNRPPKETSPFRTVEIGLNKIGDVLMLTLPFEMSSVDGEAMEGLLKPIVKEEVTALVEVRQVYHISKVGLVAGAYVVDGKVSRTNKARLIRDGIVIFTGDINALKRFKDDVKEVSTNFECGISLTNCNDIREGDTIETYQEIEVRQRL